MKQTWTTRMAGTVALAVPSLAASPATPQQTLTVLVLNQAGVAERNLDEMFRDLGVILGEAGIKPDFTLCPVSLDLPRPAVCSEAPRPGRIVLQLLPGRPAERIHAVGTSTVNRQTGISSIRMFSDLAKSLAADSGWSWPELLAHLAAHEIGHVLLDSHGHTRNGIMRPVWSSSELGTLHHQQALFDGRQAGAMRQNLVALNSRAPETPRVAE